MHRALVVNQMPSFKKAYKKLHTKIEEKVNEAIREIIKNPRIGELKKGGLAGVYVYKFKVDQQNICSLMPGMNTNDYC